MNNTTTYGILLYFLFFSYVNAMEDKYPELSNIKCNRSISSVSTENEYEQEYNNALNMIKIGDRNKGIEILTNIAQDDFLNAKKELAFLYGQDGSTLRKSLFWRKSVYQDIKDSVLAMQIGAAYKALHDNEKAKEYFIEAQKLKHPFAERALKELND